MDNFLPPCPQSCRLVPNVLISKKGSRSLEPPVAIWPFEKAISPILLDLHSQKRRCTFPWPSSRPLSLTWPPLQRKLLYLTVGFEKNPSWVKYTVGVRYAVGPLTLSCLAISAWLSNTRMFTARSERSRDSEDGPWMADASTVKSCRG